MAMRDDAVEYDWPSLEEPARSALRQAVAVVEERTEPTGIIAAGSILRGMGDPRSDIDLYVIHEQPWKQRLQRRLAGVRVEIFINNERSVRGYLEEERVEGRPITAHMLATGHVVLCRTEQVRRIIEQGRDQVSHPPEVSGQALLMQRYTIVDSLENAMDVAQRDPVTAIMILHEVVTSLVRYRFTSTGHHIPRTKELLPRMAEIDPELASLVHRFCGAPGLDGRLALATRIAHHTIGVTEFFEWESERIPVPEAPD
jgi:predicted nucleotidyltransferase